MTTVLESLNQGLHRAMAADERVYLLGEDLLDPYGGAFKVTRGLSGAFPGRVLTTPISEAGLPAWPPGWRCAVCARWSRSCSATF